MPHPIPLNDIQAGFGGATPGQPDIPTARDWLAEMNRLKIGRSLVRMVPEDLEIDARHSNDRLFAACRRQRRLIPCPVVLAAGAKDVLPEDRQVDGLIRRGAGAVWIRPAHDCWSLAPWCSDKLFAALEQRRLPLLCVNRGNQVVSLEQTAEIAGRHPRLPILLVELAYNQLRMLIPLLDRFPNISLSLGNNLTLHRGIERLVEEVGARRLIFGTGYPKSEPMAAVTQLMYAEVSTQDQRMIGAGNFERLQREVRR